MKKRNVLIISLLCIIFIVILGVFIYSKKEELDINSEFVKELHNKLETYYIPAGGDIYINNNFYMDIYVDYNDLKDEARLYYAYRYLNETTPKLFSSCDELKPYNLYGESFYDKCVRTDLGFITPDSGDDWDFYDVTKEKLEDTYHKLFGNDKKMPLTQFEAGPLETCLYSEEEAEFLCFQRKYTDYWDELYIATKVEKAIKYFDRIEIYDRYVHFTMKEKFIEGENYVDNVHYPSYIEKKYYTSTTKEKLIKEEVTQNYRTGVSNEVFAEGALYKHIFKKDNNGNYYWYSSERVE